MADSDYKIDCEMLKDAITMFVLEDATLNQMDELVATLHRAIAESYGTTEDDGVEVMVYFRDVEGEGVITKDHLTSIEFGVRKELDLDDQQHLAKLFKTITKDMKVITTVNPNRLLEEARETLEHLISSNKTGRINSVIRRKLLHLLINDYLNECQATQN